VRHHFLEYCVGKTIERVIQVPYVDDIGMNHVYAVLEELISEVRTSPEATPISASPDFDGGLDEKAPIHSHGGRPDEMN